MIHVFFDVDGVLNKESDWKVKFSLDKSCIKAFADICNYLKKSYVEVKLVIISTWRTGENKNLENALAEYGLKISDSTPVSNKGRQAEVEYYIRRNNIEDYLIIDDDLSLFSSPENLKLYVPNYRTGLVSSDIKAIRSLI